jgi:tRNA G26 N,N-dimethylase Trm1
MLGWLARQAHSRGEGLRPLFAYVGGHYLRAYVELSNGAAGGDLPVSTVDPTDFTGPSIGGSTPIGPLWTSGLVDPAFVDLLEVPRSAARPREAARLLGLLKGEARVEAMFFFEANELAREGALASPPRVDEMIRRLSERGWPAARTHARAGGFRTTAPRDEVAKVAREAAEAASGTPPRAG